LSQLSPETVLAGRYRIIRMLGGGGSGAVYLAEDLTLGALWAVKHFSLSHLSADEKKAGEMQCEKEISLLTKLSHPRLPKVADYFHDGPENAFVVMEYIQGETLAEVTARTKESPGEEKVRQWALQICEVLQYLHGSKPPVIFRDLKPHNLILTPEGVIRFVDFGIARLFNPVRDRDTLFMGTPGYAPPEQFGKGQTDQRSDIYSLGATLHFLLTGRDPGESPFHFEPLTRLNPAVSPLLEAIVARAVEIEPHHRFSSVKEMADVLSGRRKLEDLPQPQWLIVEPSEVHFEKAERGKVLKGSMTLSSPLGGKVRGRLKTAAPWLDTEREAFYGDRVEVQIEVDTEKMGESDSAASHIEVITDTMKIQVPVHVTFLPELLRRLPDWKAGALLLSIPILGGALWFGLTHLKEMPHIQGSAAAGALFALVVIALAILYRGRERSFTAIVYAMMIAYFCTDGRFLDFFLLSVYALWSARSVIRLYNGFSAEQQQELVLLYRLALAVPALAGALSFYQESYTMTFTFLGETLAASLATASIGLYSVERWRPAFTRRITASAWTGVQAGIARYKSRFFSRSLTALHLLTALPVSLAWGGLALLNGIIINGNTCFLYELRASYLPFEYWTLGLPYALSRAITGETQTELQIPATFAFAFLLSLAGTVMISGGDRLIGKAMKNSTVPYLFRAFNIVAAMNMTVLALLLLNVVEQRDIYHTPLENIRESRWIEVAGSGAMRAEVRLYGQDRLAAFYFSQGSYEKALGYYSSMEKMRQGLKDGRERLGIQIRFMTGLSSFYLDEMRQAAICFDEIIRAGELKEPDRMPAESIFQSGLTAETGMESFRLDRDGSEIIVLKTEPEREASLYYYQGLCKGYLKDYREMALSLTRAGELYGSPPLLCSADYDTRRGEIAERQKLIRRLSLQELRSGEVFYDISECSRAIEYHRSMAEWLSRHDRSFLSARERAAEMELQDALKDMTKGG